MSACLRTLGVVILGVLTPLWAPAEEVLDRAGAEARYRQRVGAMSAGGSSERLASRLQSFEQTQQETLKSGNDK